MEKKEGINDKYCWIPVNSLFSDGQINHSFLMFNLI